MQEQTIVVDQITSISNCYFGFKYGGSFVSIPSLPLKCRSTPKETSSYHLDYDDLKKIYKILPDIYPNSYSCKEWNATLKPENYMRLMLHRLQLHMLDGSIIQALTSLNGNNQEFSLAWHGPLRYSFPDLKFEK